MYGESVRFVTERTAGILLQEDPAPLRGAVCTVYTSFERGGVDSALALCAESGFFTRLTRQMLGMEAVEPQDVADFSKEYFNVLCGNITSALHRETKVAARFQIPSFCCGRYRPEGRWDSWALSLLGDRDERALLIHYRNSSAPADAAQIG